MKRLLLSLFLIAANHASAANQPNIVFILSDDLGLDGVTCYGGERVKTPHVDALAAGGVRFATCYANPLCGPSRCALMTGRYVFRTGGRTNQSAGNPSPQNEIGIAKVLKQAGYATCQVGKWRQMGARPSDWGFDEYMTDPTAGGWYWKNFCNKNGQQVPVNGYYEDALYDFAADFIRRHKEQPFFLYYPTHFVHGPILRTPDSKPNSNLYHDNLAYMDKLVGKLIAELDKLKLRENTLIVFAGDNGTAKASGSINGRQVHGHKGQLLEGGSRVPLIANWPGTTPAGKVDDSLVDFSDMFVTFAELAGAKLPERVKIDGQSFAPQIKGQPGKPREWVFVQLGNGWYVRDARWKLTETGALFDLKNAPYEEIPATNADAQKRLQAILDNLKPTGNPADTGERPRKKRRF